MSQTERHVIFRTQFWIEAKPSNLLKEIRNRGSETCYCSLRSVSSPMRQLRLQRLVRDILRINLKLIHIAPCWPILKDGTNLDAKQFFLNPCCTPKDPGIDRASTWVKYAGLVVLVIALLGTNIYLSRPSNSHLTLIYHFLHLVSYQGNPDKQILTKQ